MPSTHLDKLLSYLLHVPALNSIFRYPESPCLGFAQMLNFPWLLLYSLVAPLPNHSWMLGHKPTKYQYSLAL